MVFWITLAVSLGAVGAHVGPRLQQFSDGKPIAQGKLAACHGNVLFCTHPTPVRCVQNWGTGRGKVPAVAEGLNEYLINICELFLDVKMENILLNHYQK